MVGWWTETKIGEQPWREKKHKWENQQHFIDSFNIYLMKQMKSAAKPTVIYQEMIQRMGTKVQYHRNQAAEASAPTAAEV